MGVDLTGNVSGSFNGGGVEVFWKNAIKWTMPNATNNGYISMISWDTLANATFGAAITATSFTGPLTGNATTATNSTQLGGVGLALVMAEKVSNISTTGQADAARQQMTFSYAGSGTPVNGGFISFGGFSGGYDTQIIGNYGSSNYLGYRTRNGDINTWNPWREIISDNRIGAFAPTLTGTGASGSWGINITGTAPAGTLTGATLAAGVTASSLTSVGTLGSLTVTGSVTAGSFYTSSSREVKQNIKPFSRSALELIKGIPIVDFAYKTEPDFPRVGFIAEEVDPTFTGLSRDKFDMANTIAVLIKAVQELSEAI